MERMLDLPPQAREATVRLGAVDPLATSIRSDGQSPAAARMIDLIWTTGARVLRRRWDGWDDEVREYEEELVVSPEAIRLERMNSGAAPFLDSHSGWSLGSVLGAVVEGSVRVEAGQGVATVRLTAAPDVAPQITRILEGTVRSVSVGYRVYRYEIEKREGQRELWRAVDWEPYEVSAVAMPADSGARIRSGEDGADARAPCAITWRDARVSPGADPAASAGSSSRRSASGEITSRRSASGETTRGQGMDPEDDLARGESRVAETNPAAPAVAPAAVDADAIRAEERARVAEITALCGRHGLDGAVRDRLIRDGSGLDAARTAILEALVARDPAGRTVEPLPAEARHDSGVAYRDAMAAALMHRHDPGREQLPAAAREFRGLSLIELARQSLDRAGVSTRGMSKMEVAGLALSARATGYQGTSDFAAILGNVANKTLRNAYASTPRTFTAWARRATITDFRPVSRTQLGGAPDLQKVLEAGEFTYGTIGEGKEVYGLAAYGRIVAVTRQTLINDDLDAFTRVPAAFGAAAADLESDIVYGILVDNAAMGDAVALFHATHGNLSGAGSVISETALAAGYRAFAAQRGIEGRQISVLPRYILVPPGSRSVEARKQVTATTPGSTAEVNTFAGRLEVVEEPRLIPAAGQDPWFLAADPSRIDTVEFAYLDGQEGVYIETRAGFEVDGLEIKARHDFAAKAIDWRGLYKNAGAAAA